MKKLKLKVDRDELTTLTKIVKIEVDSYDTTNQNYNSISWSEKVLRSILRDVLLPMFLRKLITPCFKVNVSLKEFEAESLIYALCRYEIKTANPYIIALIEKVKSTQLV